MIFDLVFQFSFCSTVFKEKYIRWDKKTCVIKIKLYCDFTDYSYLKHPIPKKLGSCAKGKRKQDVQISKSQILSTIENRDHIKCFDMLLFHDRFDGSNATQKS